MPQPALSDAPRHVAITPSVQHINMPLQRPIADSRASQKHSQGTIQTDSAFKNKPNSENAFQQQNLGMDAPKPFRYGEPTLNQEPRAQAQ